MQVLSIDGATTEGWDGDRAAKSLRGTSGSSVMVKFARRSEQMPGVAGRPEQPPRTELKQAGPSGPDPTSSFELSASMRMLGRSLCRLLSNRTDACFGVKEVTVAVELAISFEMRLLRLAA